MSRDFAVWKRRVERRNEKLLNKPMCCPSRALSSRGEVQEFGPTVCSVTDGWVRERP